MQEWLEIETKRRVRMTVRLQNMKKSELTEQIKLISWARSICDYVPELKLLHHVPNEGKRANGTVLKAAGVIAGIPDLCLPVARRGYHGLYIEMKFGENKPTKQQIEVMTRLKEQGYKVCTAYSVDEARSVIRYYLARADNFDLINCEEATKTAGYCDGVEQDWTPCADCKLHRKAI